MTRQNQDAFPTTQYFGEHPTDCSEGLTKREYDGTPRHFLGLLANPTISFGDDDSDIHAVEAVRQADRLIQALNREKEEFYEVKHESSICTSKNR